MHTIITTLFLWFLPWHTWEAILPDRQRMPKAPTHTGSRYLVMSDTTRKGKFIRDARRTSRKMLDK